MLLLAAVIAVGVFAKEGPRIPDLKIEFVSVTNSPAGHIIATFSITNSHPRSVYFTPSNLQLQTPTGWTSAGTRIASGNEGLVAANGVTNLSVRVDVITNSNWRVEFFAAFPPTPIERWREVANVNLRNLSENGKWVGLNVGYALRGATNYSERFTVPYGY